MAFSFKQQKIDTEEEKRILISAIVNTAFLKDLTPICKATLFRLPHSKRIYKWIEDYYAKYEEAPGRNIETIFEVEQEKLGTAESDLISQFLDTLNTQYEEDINASYIFDRAERYLKRRSIEIHREKLAVMLDNDQIEEAEASILGYKEVAKVTSKWVNPHDPDFIRKSREKQRLKLYRLKGAVGELIGDLCRKEVLGIQGPYKVGKSFLAHELVIAGLKNRYRVAEVNLEMNDERVSDRHWKRLTAKGDRSGDYIYPTFDCHHNQVNTCKLTQRICGVALYNPDSSEKPLSYLKTPRGYKPCSYCRNHPTMGHEYQVETWYKKIVRSEITTKQILKHVNEVNRMWGDKYRLICYPRFGASMTDIERDLDILEYTEGFIPDILLCDYIDIAKPEDFSGDSEEQRKNDLWMRFAGLCAQRSLFGITLTQINKKAIDRKKGKMGDASWSNRIYGHVDKMISISQSSEEKLMLRARVNKVADRNEDFNEAIEVILLQQLEIGNSILDSEYADWG